MQKPGSGLCKTLFGRSAGKRLSVAFSSTTAKNTNDDGLSVHPTRQL